jgi:hypothetical protein
MMASETLPANAEKQPFGNMFHTTHMYEFRPSTIDWNALQDIGDIPDQVGHKICPGVS